MKLKTALLLSWFVTIGAVGAREIVHPVGEHDHFIGKVTVLPTGKQTYPDAGKSPEISISFNAADKSVTTHALIKESDKTELRATPLKTRPDISFAYALPGGATCGSYDYTYYDVSLGSRRADKQGFEFTIRTHRIDVNDMKITRQDGSTYYARGHYWIKMEDTNHEDCWILSKVSTKTGMSVPHGYTYTVITQATSEEGSELQSTVSLNFEGSWSNGPGVISPSVLGY